MKRRVAVIVPGGVGSGLAGQGIPVLVNLVVDLASQHDLTVYSLTSTDPAYRAEGFRLRCSSFSRPGRFGKLQILARIVLDHIADPYDLFHGFWARPAGLMAVFLGKLFRRPSIVSLHGGEAAAVPSIGYGNMLQPWSRALTLMSCRQASVVVALSHFQADAMRCSGLQRADVRVVPYGADEKLFTFSRRALSPPFRFLHVANLTAVKDQQTLITVFDRVQREVPATLQIISADYLDGTLQQLVKRRGLNDCVSFSGFVPYQDLPAHYPQTHFLLHTSLYEDQGVVTLEASFSGVLVCGTRTGIHPDWQGNGFITVDVGEDEVLANAIIRVIGQPESYAALIDRTRRTAGSYRRSWTAQRYFEIYRNP